MTQALTSRRRQGWLAGLVSLLLVALAAGCQVFQPAPLPTPAPTVPTDATATSARPSPSLAPTTPPTTSPELEQAAASAITAGQIRTHLEALQQIADANGGNRADGSPGYLASVTYAHDILTAAGYEVTEQKFSYPTTEVRHQSAEVVSGGKVTLSPRIMAGSPATALSVEAAVRTPAHRQGCDANDFAGLRGTIVVVERGVCAFADKSRNAATQGVAALLIYDPESSASWRGTLGESPQALAPTASLTQQEGKQLLAALASGPVRLKVNFEIVTTNRTSTNVVAQWPGQPVEQSTVMVGAHLDSVAEGPGINDNASGVATVLTLATVLAEQGQGHRVRFALWGAEELGLLGSRHYVGALTEQQRRQISVYLNFDMVASPNGTLGVYGTDAVAGVLTQAFAGHNPRTVYLGGASDHAPFVAADIEVGGVHTGASEPGSGAGPADRCYHQACDTTETINQPQVWERLDVIADGAVVAILRLRAKLT